MSSKRTSPMQLSNRWVRQHNGVPWTVERWDGPVKRDLFGLFDIVALYPAKYGTAITGIQTTTMSNMHAHKKKMLENPLLLAWLRAGGEAELHCWPDKGRTERLRFVAFVGHGNQKAYFGDPNDFELSLDTDAGDAASASSSSS